MTTPNTPIGYLRQILDEAAERTPVDPTTRHPDAARLGRIQALAAYAIQNLTGEPAAELLLEIQRDHEARELDRAAWGSAECASYGDMAQALEHVAGFKAAVQGQLCVIESNAAADGFAAGRRFRRHGGALAESHMASTVAIDPAEMRADAARPSATIGASSVRAAS